MEAGIVFVVLQAALVLSVSCVLFWMTNRRHKHSFFKKLGIPGPEPVLLWGNWRQMKKNRLQVLADWIKEYGKVFGIYLGDKPCMVITDTTLIRECFIKESKIFQDRPVYVLNVEPLTSSLPLLGGEKWRKVRAVFNSCFSAAKVKGLSGTVASSVDRFIQKLDDASRTGIAVDALEASHAMVLDIVARVVFSWQIDCQANEDDTALKALKVMFTEADNALFDAALAHPALRFLLRCIYPFSTFYKATKKITVPALQIIKGRRSRKDAARKDILQHILDAQMGQGDFSAMTNARARSIDDDVLLSNLSMLIMAGFETPSVTLAFILYLLAKHPDEQDSIRAEIATKRKSKLLMQGVRNVNVTPLRKEKDECIGSIGLRGGNKPENAYHGNVHAPGAKGGESDQFEIVQERGHKEITDQLSGDHHTSKSHNRVNAEVDNDMDLQRLDMVVREGMRLYPVVPTLVMRECSEDVTILGQFIPAGTTVMSPAWHVHRDPDIWPEPDRFIPDRFSAEGPELVTSVYYPFGLGPRMCVGYRLGMMILKKTLRRVLERYHLSLDEEVPDPLPVNADNVTLNPATPIKIRFHRRETK